MANGLLGYGGGLFGANGWDPDLISPDRRNELFGLGKSLLGWAPQTSPLDPAAMPPQLAGVAGTRPQQDLTGLPMQMPAYAPQSAPVAPGMGDRLLSGVLGFANSGGLIPSIGNLIGGLATGQRTDPTGVAERQRGEGNTDDIKEYNFARLQGYQGSLADWMRVKQRETENFALNPTYLTDDAGNVRLLQLGNRGSTKEVKLPDGTKVSTRNLIKNDLADRTQWIDPITKQVVKEDMKGIQEKEAAEERGKAQGGAQATLVNAEATANRLLSRISSLENHRGFSQAVGFIAGRLPALTPAAADFRERVAEIGSQTWTDAVKEMRGLGALSNAEGQRIETARARLATAKGEADYREALKDVRETVQTGIKNMRLIAQGKMTPYPADTAPAKPDASALKKKYNLD